MDTFTHALTSIALDRAGLRRVSPWAMSILIVSGVAADLDLLSYFGGATAYFRYHYAVLHSILGSAILAVLIAVLFWAFSRSSKRPLQFSRVLLLCFIGAGLHVLLDYFGAEGVQLFWPFHRQWFSLDWLPETDPWIIAVLLVGSLLPALFRLVTEEIGGRKRTQKISSGAIVALALMGIYIGARAMLHGTAGRMLMDHDYHGAAPLAAEAFPHADSPLLWRGVIATASTIEVVSVPVGPIGEFHPMSSLTYYKPPDSPALDAAQRAPLAAQFLKCARFPLANLQGIQGGWIITVRDMRYRADAQTAANMRVVVQLNAAMQLQNEHMEFAAAATR